MSGGMFMNGNIGGQGEGFYVGIVLAIVFVLLVTILLVQGDSEFYKTDVDCVTTGTIQRCVVPSMQMKCKVFGHTV